MKKILTIMCLLLSINTMAQNKKKPYQIDIQVKGIKDTICYLGNYFFTETSGKFFIQDTAKVDHQGRMSFKGDSALAGGLYIVTVPTRAAYFEIVVGDEQNFSIETDTTDFVATMKVTGSKEVTLFNDFRKEMGNRYQKMIAVDKTRKGPTDKVVNDQIKTMQGELSDFQQKFFKDNQGTLVVKLIKSAQDPVMPEALKAPKTKQDTLDAYNFYKNHFLDNLDLTDERLMRTPYLGNRLMGYMSFGGGDPDTLIKLADNIMFKASKSSKAMRKAIIYYLTNQYETGDEKKGRLMGTEAVFVHMGKRYYIGEPTLWDTSTTRRFQERIATLEPVLLGKTARNLYPTDSLGNYITPLYEIKSKYTVLFIFDPNCSHCKEKAPKLVEWYNTSKFKDMTKIYTVCGEHGDKAFKDWKDFLKTSLKGNKFYNGFDKKIHTDFRNWFDVVSYPVMYLLDKDKKIVGRGIGVGDLDGVIDMREQMEKAEQAGKAKGKK